MLVKTVLLEKNINVNMENMRITKITPFEIID